MELNEILDHLDKLASFSSSIYKEYVDRNKKYAPDFNIFCLGTKEFKNIEQVHQDFIAELLDPNGSHGQGSLFLKHFFNICQNLKTASGSEDFPELPKNIEKFSWYVEKEYQISSGRIDVVIRSIDARVLIAIEIKIADNEQKDQLERYSNFLERQNSYNRTALVYLTPNGTESKTAGNHPYYPMSFKTDILTWISECKEQIDCPKITVIFDHYLEALKLLGDKSMKKETQFYQEKIIDYLITRDNIKFAWELGDLFENNLFKRMKDKLREDFWRKLTQTFQEKERTSRNMNWEIRSFEIKHYYNAKEIYFDFPAEEGHFYLRPAIQEEYSKPRKDYNIFYGMEWNEEMLDEPEIQGFLDFKDQLIQDNFYIEKNNPNWLATKYAEIWTYSEEFALRITEEGMDFINEFVEKIWEFIEKYNKPLKKINSLLYEYEMTKREPDLYS